MKYELRVVRGTLDHHGLGHILDPVSVENNELRESAQAAHDTFVGCERLLDRASRQLLKEVCASLDRTTELSRDIVNDSLAVPRDRVIVNPTIEIARTDTVEAGASEPSLARLANGVARQNRISHHTMRLTVRLAAHRALHALGAAVEEAGPGEDRDHADTIARELLQLAEAVGLADDHPLARLWPTLVVRPVQVARVQRQASAPTR